MSHLDLPNFPHLVAAAEAVEAGTLALGEQFTDGATNDRWEVQTIDTYGTIFVPDKAGRCYPTSYVLGEAREAILRTAAIRDRMAAK